MFIISKCCCKIIGHLQYIYMYCNVLWVKVKDQEFKLRNPENIGIEKTIKK